MSKTDSDQDHEVRLRLTALGAVQGVGFRPFVYRLANELKLGGYVSNTSHGVIIEVEGEQPAINDFRSRLTAELPPQAFLTSLESVVLDCCGHSEFAIVASSDTGGKTALVLPDLATCPDCLRDISDPANRRYQYPFTNCTNCGPRYSIIESLPYDRARTTMKHFTMCADCRAEYEDPGDRRFHAQPNACPVCGPQLELWSPAGDVHAAGHEALQASAAAIRAGEILAVKGLGGFHLVVAATNEAAVLELRRRKQRNGKPLAVMFGELGQIESCCLLSDAERNLISSVESPIVLVAKRQKSTIASAVAPRNPYLGVLLPYTPIHHLLMRELDCPIVATSGNLSEEPICIDEREALGRLGGIADLFMVHNRPIGRHVDDSVVRIVAGRPQVLRRARGYAPLPIRLNEAMMSLAAVGAHLKNSVAIAHDRNVFVSQHIGDLETLESYRAFTGVITDLAAMYEHHPVAIAHDLHPDYRSTHFATKTGVRTIAVQHHYAHALACIAENELPFPVLAISWDGTGYGNDGTIWGGEFLTVDESGFQRCAHLKQFRLPGGDAAIKEPRRSAAGLLFAACGGSSNWNIGLMPESFGTEELRAIEQMLHTGINSPLTSSAGRLFDAVAALLDLAQVSTFEGEGAMLLEFAVEELDSHHAYSFDLKCQSGSLMEIDWTRMIHEITAERDAGRSAGQIAARFHDTLVEMMVAVAKESDCRNVALTGGCFQNKYLTERAIRRLEECGFAVYRHQRVPPNDGGIAFGQIVAAARELRRSR